MIHEDAVLAKHPRAREFRPVKRIFGPLLGWTFEIPHDGADPHARSFGWVTCDAEVSSDTLRARGVAEQNLTAYMRSRSKSTLKAAPVAVEDKP